MSTECGSAKLRARGTPAQARLVHTDAPFPAFVGGYGSGKTQALCYRAIHLLLRDRAPIGYYMPTYGLLEDVAIPRLMTLLDQAGLTPKKRMVAGRPSIEVPGWGPIVFRTLDRPDAIVGYETGHALVDELDTLPPEKAADCWHRILARNRAKLPEGRRNTVAVGTTPEGFRFVWERWGRDPAWARAQGYELIRARTRDNAHNLPPDYIETLSAQYPQALLRAYLDGEFVNLSDGIIQAGWFRRCAPPPGLRVSMGVDLAISLREGADRTAFVVMGRHPMTGHVHVLHAEASRLTFDQTIQRIETLARQYAPAAVAVEAVQYQAAVVQELNRRTTLPVRPVRPDRDKATRLLPLAARYEQGLVWHAEGAPGIAALEAELVAFPNGEHDDLVDAAVYAWHALDRPGGRVALAGEPAIALI